jgi:hypothetical protein
MRNEDLWSLVQNKEVNVRKFDQIQEKEPHCDEMFPKLMEFNSAGEINYYLWLTVQKFFNLCQVMFHYLLVDCLFMWKYF